MEGCPFWLSVVTVTYNCGDILETTIRSVIQYKDAHMEYIIIDGGSTDKTLDCISKYSDDIDFFISEPDRGIYDAMNKGIKVAKGMYILNVNAGDCLIDSPTRYLTERILIEKYDLIMFNVLLSSGKIFNSHISKKLKIANTVHHQGALYFRNPLYLYDLNYRVFSDFDYNQRLYSKKTFRSLKIDKTISQHDLGGISHSKSFFGEMFGIIYKNFGVKYVALSWLYYKYQGLKKRINLCILF